jgi:leucyl-tRNA synthetase/inosine/xanthosine triphosphate pyrophosphatase family protein/predicted NUDIX family NTP pyrophosphohydrolase
MSQVVESGKFDFTEVEARWQQKWLEENTYEAQDNDITREKKYILVEFPFPSGANLHVGHIFRYTVPDIYSRFLRMRGYNVLFPMGWDAFGLPAEEFARKTGQNPRITTEQNIAGIKKNIQKMGYGIDWNREINTTDPEYYKWTQWIFKQFYNEGLAVQKDVELWWCEALGTVLANEEVYDSPEGLKLSERGDHPVEKKKMKQWVLRMPEYAQKLLDGLEETHFPESVKAMQRTWIGKSEGVVVDWNLVPAGYTDKINNYPNYNIPFGGHEIVEDPKLFVRERASAVVRIRETGQIVVFTHHSKQNGDFLHFPGGGLDVGDSPLDAAIRETEEELGITDMEYITELGSVSHYTTWDGKPVRGVGHYFLFEISEAQFLARKPAEVDLIGGAEHAEVFSVEPDMLRSTGWDATNYIVDNLLEYYKTGKIESVEAQNRDVVLATGNAAKVKRLKRELNFNGVNLVDFGAVEAEENGATELENAQIKAQAYYKASGKPSIATDTGIYLVGVPEGEQPGKDTKRAAGVSESDSPEVYFEKMIKFYTSLVDKYGVGGQLEAYFLDAFCLYDGLQNYEIEVRRPIVITDQIHETRDLNFPLCSIYKDKKSGKMYHDLNAFEMKQFLAGYSAARKLLFDYIYDGESAGQKLDKISTFTTRVDTLPSCTFVVVAPEFPGLLEFSTTVYELEVANYIEATKNKSERERQINKEKSGVFTGRFVTNPLTGMMCPVWVSDFVLGGYGTGAVMGDGHDERDTELALKYGIYLEENVAPETGQKRENEEFRSGGCGVVFDPETQKYAFAGFEDGRYLFFAGGNDEGESVKNAVIREVKEESGLTNFTSIEQVGYAYTHFHNQMKKVNRVATVECYNFVLTNSEVVEVSREAHENFQLVWRDAKEVLDCWTRNNADEGYTHYIEFLKKAVAKNISRGVDKVSDPKIFVNKPFTGDGILYNSGEFDGLNSNDARQQIGAYLVSQNQGQIQTNFRMRDFVFSRQRYWGEPFPFETVEKANPRIWELNFRGENVAKYLDKILSGDKKIEIRALNPEEKNKYFGEIEIGDKINLIDKNQEITHQYFASEVKTFKKIEDALNCNFDFKAVFPDISGLQTLELVKKEFADTDYFELIQKNGFVAILLSKEEAKILRVLDDSQLPLELPDLEDFAPTNDGQSPLAKSDWINVRNAQGEVIGHHEADTMPNWAGSSWYYMRFIDPKNSEEFASQEKLNYWLPVDHYFGGSEHTTLHLLYSRFWHKFLFDKGLVPTPEPYDYRTNGGILLGPDGAKMSKSKGNVIQPDDKLASVGADALRLYIAFIGPYDATVIWQDGGLKACKTVVDRVWDLRLKIAKNPAENKKLVVSYNKFVKSITGLLTDLKNNVAVAEIMTFSNLLRDQSEISQDIWEGFLKVLAVFAPHVTEELYRQLGYTKSIHLEQFPNYDEKYCIDEEVKYVVQINGKLRGEFEIPAGSSDEQVLKQAKTVAAKYLENQTIKFTKIIPNKLVTIVVE